MEQGWCSNPRGDPTGGRVAPEARIETRTVSRTGLDTAAGGLLDHRGQRAQPRREVALEELEEPQLVVAGRVEHEVGEAPVEIVSADHQNKADVGSNVARQWLDVDKVAELMAAKNVVDARNLLDRAALSRRGFEYEGIGRK